MDHGVSMLNKKEKAGKGEKGRKKKGLESEPDNNKN